MTKRRSEMTKEELEKARIRDREYKRMISANMTPYQEKKLYLQRRAQRERRQVNMTPEERDLKRNHNRDYMRQYKRKRLALMSPEERVDYWKSLYAEKKIRAWEKSLNAVASAKRSNHNG